MAKELLQNWNGRQVLSNDHIPELEADAYLYEAKGFPRDQAAQAVHNDYKRKHLIQAAAFHMKAMKAAQAMGNMQEAQKHMLTHGLAVQALGLDPYGATHPEILAAAQDPNMQIPYKFTAHPADAFLLQQGAAQPQQGGTTMNKHEIGHEIYKVLKKATEVLEGAAQSDGSVPGKDVEKSEFTDKIQAARGNEARACRDEAGLSYHLNGDNSYSRKQQARYEKLSAKNRREKARSMAKSDLSPFVKAELEGYDNGAPCQDCGKNPCVCPDDAKPCDTDCGSPPKAEGNAAPLNQADKTGAATAASEPVSSGSGTSVKGDAFSTTLTGADNAMGKPSAIPGQPEFCTTLTGQNSVMPTGSIPTVPFSTTLEGNDAAKLTKHEILHGIHNVVKGILVKNGINVIGGDYSRPAEDAGWDEQQHYVNRGTPTDGYSAVHAPTPPPELGGPDQSIHQPDISNARPAGGLQGSAYDMQGAQDMTTNAYNVDQNMHPYGHLSQQGWTPAMTSIGHAAMKPAAGGGVYSIHNIGSRHHVIHSDAEGNITPLGIHGDTRTAKGHELAMGAVAHHELMSRGGMGQGQPGIQGPQSQPLLRSEIYNIQMELAPLYRGLRPLTKHDLKHNIKISQSMGGRKFMDEQGNVYHTLGEAAERLGLQASHIDEVLHGARQQANGHSFKYVD